MKSCNLSFEFLFNFERLRLSKFKLLRDNRFTSISAVFASEDEIPKAIPWSIFAVVVSVVCCFVIGICVVYIAPEVFLSANTAPLNFSIAFLIL